MPPGPLGGTVLVKKPHTNPARRAIHLSTSRPFAGHGTLTITQGSGQVRIFTTANGGTAVASGAQFAGAVLTPGVTVFAEGTNASTALNDVTLSLALSGGPNPIGPAATATMTAVAVTLDLADRRVSPAVAPAALSAAQKQNPGRFLNVQDAANRRRRGALIIHQATPAAFQGDLVVTPIDNRVRLFSAEDPSSAGQVALRSPHAIANNTLGGGPVRLFAEGANVSHDLRDTGFRLGLRDVDPDGDRVAITVVNVVLDVCQSRTAAAAAPAAMTAVDKHNVGRFVHVQDPNTQCGRAMLIIHKVQPAAVTESLVLTRINNEVAAFRNEHHPAAGAEAAQPDPETIPAGLIPPAGLQRFIEGIAVSPSLRHTGYRLGLQGIDPDLDEVAVTVVRLSNLTAEIPSTAAGTARFNNNPVPKSKLALGTNAAPTPREFDERFANNAPLVLIENSVIAGNEIAMSVQIAPVGVPVRWDTQRVTVAADRDSHDIINNLVPAPASTKPTITAVAANPLQAKMLLNSVGSFHIRAFVDCNANNTFEDLEPCIIMNLVVVRAQGATNTSAASNANWKFAASGAHPVPPGAAFAATAATGLALGTGEFANAATAAVHNNAIVNLIGGGPTGVAGLDQVFLGWVNNELDANTPTRPVAAGGEDVVSSYLDTTGAAPTTHTRISVWMQGAVGPLAGPVLDTTNFGDEGTGGNRCVGTEGAVGPRIVHALAAPLGTPGNVGKSLQVEMWDSPGDDCPPALTALPGALTNYRFNLDFRSDLLVWTNSQRTPTPTPRPVTSPASPAPHPACCLYATVQTNTWSIRFVHNFGALAAAVPAGVVALIADGNPTRLAARITTTEVRFPISLRLLSIQERP